jgi:streptogramin lyase
MRALVLANLGSGAPTVVKDSLVKLDPDTGKVLDVTRVGGQPVSVAVAGDTVWTGNIDESTLTSVDSKPGHVGTVGGIRTPFDLAADCPRHLWFSTYGYDQVTRIDTRTRCADVVVPVRNKWLGAAWVTNGGDASVSRINLDDDPSRAFPSETALRRSQSRLDPSGCSPEIGWTRSGD